MGTTFVFTDFLLNHLLSELYLVTVSGMESDQSVYSVLFHIPAHSNTNSFFTKIFYFRLESEYLWQLFFSLFTADSF